MSPREPSLRHFDFINALPLETIEPLHCSSNVSRKYTLKLGQIDSFCHVIGSSRHDLLLVIVYGCIVCTYMHNNN